MGFAFLGVLARNHSSSPLARLLRPAVLCHANSTDALTKATRGVSFPFTKQKALEEAVRKSPRAGAYCALGFARLEAAERAKAGSEAFREALRSARGAYRLARESDSRGRYRQDLWELRRRLRGLEGASKAPAAAAKPAQAGSASATIPVVAQPSPPSNGDKPAP